MELDFKIQAYVSSSVHSHIEMDKYPHYMLRIETDHNKRHHPELLTHVNPWLIHVNVWQKPLQYCKVISFQRIKINGKKNYSKTSAIALSFHEPDYAPTLHIYPSKCSDQN